MLLLEKRKIKGLLETIHFVGIGGIGMSGIALILHNLGYKVQGSDITSNDNTRELEALGIKIFDCQNQDNIQNISYMVISSAIKADNPEVITAAIKKIPIIGRAEMLAELMRLKCSIAISGSHGKTTTTSLVACLFEAAGLCPTVINGGIINAKATNAYVGTSDYLIAEADESDATFIKIPSTIGVITNIDPEHMDFYKDFDSLTKAFESFINNLPFYGFGVICVDHPVAKKVAEVIGQRRIITYGTEQIDASVRAVNIELFPTHSIFDVIVNLPQVLGRTIIEQIYIPIAGQHNVLNALAAIAIGCELDFGPRIIKEGFKKFSGVKRRFTKVGEYNGATLIDDYAHHPDEILATLSSARRIAEANKGRVIAIFQPHRYSRLQYLFKGFTNCFNSADLVYITEVYSAGEEFIDGISISGRYLAVNIENKKAEFIDSYESLLSIVKLHAQKNDIIVMMGAGNITLWTNKILNDL